MKVFTTIFALLGVACARYFPYDPKGTALPPKGNDTYRLIAVGDSITHGYMSTDVDTKSWPAQLDAMHGPWAETLEVFNLGTDGATARKGTKNSYWDGPQFKQASSSAADYVVIMLGTNDANSYFAPWNETAYINDYVDLIMFFQNMSSVQDIRLMTSVPIYSHQSTINNTEDNTFINVTLVNSDMANLVHKIADQAGIEKNKIIDGFNGMGGANLTNYELFCDGTWADPKGKPCDGIHPNNMGYAELAQLVFHNYWFNNITVSIDDGVLGGVETSYNLYDVLKENTKQVETSPQFLQ